MPNPTLYHTTLEKCRREVQRIETVLGQALTMSTLGYLPIFCGEATAIRGLTARIKTQKSVTLKLSRVYKLWTLLSKWPIKNNQKNNHNKLYMI
jgi:hypothetical protein